MPLTSARLADLDVGLHLWKRRFPLSISRQAVKYLQPLVRVMVPRILLVCNARRAGWPCRLTFLLWVAAGCLVPTPTSADKTISALASSLPDALGRPSGDSSKVRPATVNCQPQVQPHISSAPETTPEMRHSPSGDSLISEPSHHGSCLTCWHGHLLLINRCPCHPDSSTTLRSLHSLHCQSGGPRPAASWCLIILSFASDSHRQRRISTTEAIELRKASIGCCSEENSL
jgi:hypothetical protein